MHATDAKNGGKTPTSHKNDGYGVVANELETFRVP